MRNAATTRWGFQYFSSNRSLFVILVLKPNAISSRYSICINKFPSSCPMMSSYSPCKIGGYTDFALCESPTLSDSSLGWSSYCSYVHECPKSHPYTDLPPQTPYVKYRAIGFYICDDVTQPIAPITDVVMATALAPNCWERLPMIISVNETHL